MLSLPLLLLVIFLCVGLIYSIQGLIILDQAVAETCGELAESSYLMQQAWGMGMDLLHESETFSGLADATGSDLLRDAAGFMLASNYLNIHLKEHPEVRRCIEWKLAKLPGRIEDDGTGDANGISVGNGIEVGNSIFFDTFFFDDDDVALVLSFTPARLNRVTSMLPGAWQITIIKSQRAWLTGRNLLPGRGLEQFAGAKGRGPLVYITRWGEKYHKDECRYLRKSQIPAYLNELSEAYGACSVCKPPQRNGEN